MKRVVIPVLVVLVLLVGGLIAYAQLQPAVSDGNLSRDVQPRLLWGSGQSEVVFTRIAQPNIQCPPSRVATNIILLIDESGSMKFIYDSAGGKAPNDAFDNALDAAEQFISLADYDVVQIMSAFFSDRVTSNAEFMRDPAVLQSEVAAYRGNVVDRGTNFGAALTFAEAQFEAVESNAQPVLLILTDGRQDEVAGVEAVVERLNSAEIRVITVAVGEDSDKTFLRQLASSQNDYYESLTSSDLAEIYAAIVEEINNAAAFDVRLTEVVNEALNIVDTSVVPDGNVQGNQITWEMASLANEDTTFRYDVVPDGIGLHRVSSEESMLSLTDCIAGPVMASLASGPALLVMPSLPIFLGLLALLGLLPLLLFGFFNRGKNKRDTPSPTPTPKSSRPKPDIPTDLTPIWLKSLDEMKRLSADVSYASEQLRTAAIVGIGPIGRIVIDQIAQILKPQYGGKLPENIRLLQIDIRPKGVTKGDFNRPPHLAPEEYVLLEPDFKQLQRNYEENPSDWQHWDWYAGAYYSERSKARMALFEDLNGGDKGSTIWRALSRVVHALEQPKLRVVGSTFDDTSSGILIDIARLMQTISGGNAQTGTDVEMWLSGPLNQSWSGLIDQPRRKLSVGDQQMRTLATLREMERFQRNDEVLYQYVPDNNRQSLLRQKFGFAVVQTLYLFTPQDTTISPTDHLTSISDCLLATLHTSVQQSISTWLNNSLGSRLTNEQGIGTLCVMGSYAIRVPSAALSSALRSRMLMDLLFEKQLGLFPRATLRNDGSYQEIDVKDVAEQPELTRDALKAFVQRYEEFIDTANFKKVVTEQLNRILNGKDDDAETRLFSRAGGLIQAERWLSRLKSALVQKGMRDAVKEVVTPLQEEVERWQEFFEDSLYPQVKQRLSHSQEQLAALEQEQGREWLVSSEWDEYHNIRKIRTWTGEARPSTNTSGEPLLRAAQRFGWRVAYSESTRRWTLDLLIPNSTYVYDSLDNLDIMTVQPDADQIMERLDEVVRPLTLFSSDQRDIMARVTTDDKKVADWVKRADFRAKVNETRAERIMGGDIQGAKMLLVAPRSNETNRLESQLAKVDDSTSVEHCETQDNSAVTLIRLRDRVPLSTTENYNTDRWDAHFVPPEMYVWRGEQLASKLEETHRFNSEFVGWLQRDSALLRLFGMGYLFKLYHQGTRTSYLPGLGDWMGSSLDEALDNLFNNTGLRPSLVEKREIDQREYATAVDELAQAVEKAKERKWDEVGRRAYLREVREEKVAPLKRHESTRVRDFAAYLEHLVEELDQ